MRNIKLLIEYDGTNYLGWQIQRRGPTIQGMIEEKLKLIAKEEIHLIGSGRTDAGVHAMAQVANFKTNTSIDVNSLKRALNSLLPKDILIKEVEEVEEGFHARKNSKSKIYEYFILNKKDSSVFIRQYSWHIPQKLNLVEMKRATEILIGEHDFSSFRSSGSFAKTSIRRIINAGWKRSQSGLLRFEIEANGFLRQMVRAIVGTLVEVGRGRIDAQGFREILESKNRKKAGSTAPAHGLFLKEVKY